MVQFLVELPTGKARAVSVPTDTSLGDFKLLLQDIEGIPIEAVSLFSSGRPLQALPLGASTISVRVGGLKGGKGGFGALLRSSGKGASAKRTVDFGACRDLSGRRLRHVNDEIRLKMVREAGDKAAPGADEWEKTPSGIGGWFLGVPTWADGVKNGKVRGLARGEKKCRKTKMCTDWLVAREKRTPPKNASVHWGCPRGLHCDFAHGEAELRGTAKEALLLERLRAEQERRERGLTSMAEIMEEVENGMADAVAEGLMYVRPCDSADARRVEGRVKRKREEAATVHKSAALPVSLDTSVAVNSRRGIAGTIVPLSGRESVDIRDNGVVTGLSSFPTVTVGDVHLTAGRWWFEVELGTDGLMQIGAAGPLFSCDSASGDGVGDSEHSWAFDGLRCQKWNGRSARYGRRWSAGDTVGVGIDADSGTIVFALNGEPLGEAFTGVDCSGGVCPAVSLEKNEIVRINTGGDSPFLFPPSAEFRAVGSWSKTALPQQQPRKEEEEEPVEAPCEPDPPAAKKRRVEVDLDGAGSAEELLGLGLAGLKRELEGRGLKCGGTLEQRAQRLFAVKGLEPRQFPAKFRAKTKGGDPFYS